MNVLGTCFEYVLNEFNHRVKTTFQEAVICCLIEVQFSKTVLKVCIRYVASEAPKMCPCNNYPRRKCTCVGCEQRQDTDANYPWRSGGQESTKVKVFAFFADGKSLATRIINTSQQQHQQMTEVVLDVR